MNVDGIGNQEIRHRSQEAQNILGGSNSIWWDKNIMDVRLGPHGHGSRSELFA